jgi:CheY-like chemotaxis protein
VAPVAYRILVVEDEVDTRELLDFTLRWNGHEVDIAEDGREALELLAHRSYVTALSPAVATERLTSQCPGPGLALFAPTGDRGRCPNHDG